MPKLIGGPFDPQAIAVATDQELKRLWKVKNAISVTTVPSNDPRYPQWQAAVQAIQQRVNALGGLPQGYYLDSDPTQDNGMTVARGTGVSGTKGQGGFNFSFGRQYTPGGGTPGNTAVGGQVSVGFSGGRPPGSEGGTGITPTSPTAPGGFNFPRQPGGDTAVGPLSPTFGGTGRDTGVNPRDLGGASFGGPFRPADTAVGPLSPTSPGQNQNKPAAINWGNVISQNVPAIMSLIGAMQSGTRNVNVANAELAKKKLAEYNRTQGLRQGLEVGFNQQLPTHLQQNLPQNFLTTGTSTPRVFDYNNFPLYPF